jgi:pimeloyl-ACP methyl ester carboxylesterase
MPAIREKTAVTISAMGSLLLAAGFALCGVAVAAATERRSELVRYNDVQIDVVIDGNGPAVVLLPSLARDSDDYDEVAEGLAAAGFCVLRPKPRGIGRSTGPMTKITLHDFARDIAEVVKKLGGGKAVVVGHAFGNWVARMTAADHPDLVRGVVIAAAAAKQYAPELSTAVTKAGDLSLSDEERLAALRFAFFAPGHDATVWLKGWHPEIRDSQRAAVTAVKQDEWWSGGHSAAPGFAGRERPFQAGIQTERDEERVRIARYGDGHSEREPRADSRAAQGRRRGPQPMDQGPALS